jgi:hypothetical protein
MEYIPSTMSKGIHNLSALLSGLCEQKSENQWFESTTDTTSVATRELLELDLLYPVPSQISCPRESFTSNLGLSEVAKQRVSFDFEDIKQYNADIRSLQSLAYMIMMAEAILDKKMDQYVEVKEKCDLFLEELEFMQMQSLRLSKRLLVKREAARSVSTIANCLILKPTVIELLLRSDMTDQWRQALQLVIRQYSDLLQLKSCIKLVKPNKDNHDREGTRLNLISSAESIRAAILDFSFERICTHICSQINRIRNPGVNIQAIHSELLNDSELFLALDFWHPRASSDLLLLYERTARWYYRSYMNRYIYTLRLMKIHSPIKSSLLGTESRRIHGRNRRSMSRLSVPNSSLIPVKARAGILTVDFSDVMTVKDVASSDDVHWLEIPFRSLNIVLVDNVTAEYRFNFEFCCGDAGDEQSHRLTTGDRVIQILQPTVDAVMAYVTQKISESFDVVGVLLCICLCDKLLLAQKCGNILFLQKYLFHLKTDILLERFKVIIQEHCDTLDFASEKYTDADSLQLTPLETTQQFGDLLSGMLTINISSSDLTESIGIRVEVLTRAFQSFLDRLSLKLDTSNRFIFLYHNYLLVSIILQVSYSKNSRGTILTHRIRMVLCHIGGNCISRIS